MRPYVILTMRLDVIRRQLGSICLRLTRAHSNRWLLQRIALAGLATLVAAAISCSPPPGERPPRPPLTSSSTSLFVDRAAETGLEFTHWNGMTGALYFAEHMGAGGALFDADNDGDLDVYLVQGAPLGSAQPLAAPSESPPRDRLFRNDLAHGEEGAVLHFTDVTDASQLDATHYGMGVSTGDYDNDGWIDLYLTAFGPNQLWRNRGDGTFEDVTEHAGAGDTRWSSGASFVDVDRDGWLDLYIVSYVDYRLANHTPCRSPAGRLDYCGPLAYAGVSDRLLRNRGDGTFEEISGRAGLLSVASGGLGVVALDADLDGWIDLYVANDERHNQLWMNRGDGTFEDRALLAGAAVNAVGAAEASMGVMAGDIDNDGDDDLFLSHLVGETNTLYLNDGKGTLHDRSAGSGLDLASRPTTGFGAAFLDVDNDGWHDVAVANGAVTRVEELEQRGDFFPLGQADQLFLQLSPEGSATSGTSPGTASPRPTFRHLAGEAGPSFTRVEVGRGLAVGDLDNDGDADLLLTNNNGPARLLINQVGQDRAWIGLRAVDLHGRDALGARVEIRRHAGPTLWRRVASDGSYASASDPRALAGLGHETDVDEVRVHWPSGAVEAWINLAPRRYHTLVEGTGQRIHRDAIHTTAGELAPSKNIRPTEIRPTDIRTPDIRTPDTGTREVRSHDKRASP